LTGQGAGITGVAAVGEGGDGADGDLLLTETGLGEGHEGRENEGLGHGDICESDGSGLRNRYSEEYEVG